MLIAQSVAEESIGQRVYSYLVKFDLLPSGGGSHAPSEGVVRKHPMSDTPTVLYPKDQVPPVFWEIGILHGYRKPDSSPAECIKSALILSNETLNFWTHFLSAWYFLWQFGQFLQDGLGKTPSTDPYTWPFFAYLCTVCIWPLVSSAAHLFNVISETARHVCFFVDYVAISIFSFGTAIAYQAYCVNAHWSYLWVSLAASLTCTLMACASRFVTCLRWRKVMRVSSFVIPYMWTGLPLFRRILTGYTGVGGPLGAFSAWNHLSHVAISAFMCLVYSLHIPERWAPGRFDLVGHSHQIMHCLSVAFTYVQMWAVHTDVQLSVAAGRAPVDGFFGWSIVVWITVALAGNLALFLHFLRRLTKLRSLNSIPISMIQMSRLDESSGETDLDQEQSMDGNSDFGLQNGHVKFE